MKPYIPLMKHFIRHNQFQECDPPTANGDYWITLRATERYLSASRIENTHSDISQGANRRGIGILTDSSLSDFEQSPQIFGGGKQLTNNNNLPYKIVLNFVSCWTFRNLQKIKRKKTKQQKTKRVKANKKSACLFRSTIFWLRHFLFVLETPPKKTVHKIYRNIVSSYTIHLMVSTISSHAFGPGSNYGQVKSVGSQNPPLNWITNEGDHAASCLSCLSHSEALHPIRLGSKPLPIVDLQPLSNPVLYQTAASCC